MSETMQTLVAEIVGFLIVVFVIWRYVVPPANRAMQRRQDAIRAQYQEADEAKRRNEAAAAEHARAVEEAQREGTRMREAAQDQQRQIVEEARGEARKKTEEILARAEVQAQAMQQLAIPNLRGEVEQLTVQLAHRIVAEALSDGARQQRVIDRFLDDLEQPGALQRDRE